MLFNLYTLYTIIISYNYVKYEILRKINTEEILFIREILIGIN